MSSVTGSTVKSFRSKSGKTVSVMARELGVDKSTIYKYESGRTNVSSNFIEKVKEVYGFDLTGKSKKSSKKTTKASSKKSLIQVVTKSKKSSKKSSKVSSKKSFSEYIKSHRSNLGLSLSDYGNRYGVSKTYVWNIEQGKFFRSIPVSFVKGLLTEGIDLKEVL